ATPPVKSPGPGDCRRTTMKRKLVAIATLISLGLSSAASATPFYLDFTGTIPAGTPEAGAISGGFTFDTDRLFEPTLPVATQRQWIDFQPANLSEALGV